MCFERLRRSHTCLIEKLNNFQPTQSSATHAQLKDLSIPLDLNRVTVEDLCLIPGIGESLAREIVTHREKRKGFRSVDELKNVKGIGEKKWNDLKKFFTVQND